MRLLQCCLALALCQCVTVAPAIVLTAKDYSNSRAILLPYGEERTIECSIVGLPFASNGRPLVWYFGDFSSVRRVHFDANGRFPTAGSSELRALGASKFAILARASGFPAGGQSWGRLNFSRHNEDFNSSATVGPNGVLACSRASSWFGRRQPPLLIAVFHLMLVTPPSNSGGCPLPGYRLGSFAGRPACHPCLPGEFAPSSSTTSAFSSSPAAASLASSASAVCLPCPPGFESRRFAADACSLPPAVGRSGRSHRRRRRSSSMAAASNSSSSSISTNGTSSISTNGTSNSTSQLQHKQLPLASFTGIVMYHFLLVLILSAILFTHLVMAAFSFDTVWHGVLSETETSIATVLEDRFVLDQPEPDNEPDSD